MYVVYKVQKDYTIEAGQIVYRGEIVGKSDDLLEAQNIASKSYKDSGLFPAIVKYGYENHEKFYISKK